MSKTSQRRVTRQSEARKLYEQGRRDALCGETFRWASHRFYRAYDAGYHQGKRLPRQFVAGRRERLSMIRRLFGPKEPAQ